MAQGNDVQSLADRLALDRYLMGLWTERDLAGHLAKQPSERISELVTVTALDRPKRAEALRAQHWGAPRPTPAEELEALVREGVERTQQEMPILPELQYDLLAHAEAVAPDDPVGVAARLLAQLGAVSQTHVALQAIGQLAESTADRVKKARAETLEKLRRVLGMRPHLAPHA